MLTRQKIILRFLTQRGRPIKRTVFMKLMFLLRHESVLKKDPTFYDFLPYRDGPFSFSLDRELDILRRADYLTPEEGSITLRCEQLAREKTAKLQAPVHEAVSSIVDDYGHMSNKNLKQKVDDHNPWYSNNNELPGDHDVTAPLAVYTSGYQGQSVDAFFNELLSKGIKFILDVRANPFSRKYGFSYRLFRDIARKLKLGYRNIPSLGIPSSLRRRLNGYDSYQLLLKRYENEILSQKSREIDEVAQLMHKQPTVLVCFEKDVQCCHRSRLAEEVACESNLEVRHL